MNTKLKTALLTGATVLACAGSAWAAASGVPGVDAPANGGIAIASNGVAPLIGTAVICAGAYRFASGHKGEGLVEVGSGTVAGVVGHVGPAIMGAFGGVAAALISIPPHHLHTIAQAASRLLAG